MHLNKIRFLVIQKCIFLSAAKLATSLILKVLSPLCFCLLHKSCVNLPPKRMCLFFSLAG